MEPNRNKIHMNRTMNMTLNYMIQNHLLISEESITAKNENSFWELLKNRKKNLNYNNLKMQRKNQKEVKMKETLKLKKNLNKNLINISRTTKESMKELKEEQIEWDDLMMKMKSAKVCHHNINHKIDCCRISKTNGSMQGKKA